MLTPGLAVVTSRGSGWWGRLCQSFSVGAGGGGGIKIELKLLIDHFHSQLNKRSR